MEVSIRAARAADRAAIERINRDGQPGVNAFLPGEIEVCLERATLFRVAESEGRVCGYLLAFAAGFSAIGDEYAWFAARHPSFLYVDQIAVGGDSWRARVGTSLYDDLAREARSLGIPRLVCEVNLRPPNPRSLAFHTRLGFLEVGRLEVSDGRLVALLDRALS